MPPNRSNARRAGLAAPNAAPKNEAPDTIGGPNLKQPDYRTATRDRETFNMLRLRFAEQGHCLVRIAEQTFLATYWGRSKALTGLTAVQQLARELGVVHG